MDPGFSLAPGGISNLDKHQVDDDYILFGQFLYMIRWLKIIQRYYDKTKILYLFRNLVIDDKDIECND